MRINNISIACEHMYLGAPILLDLVKCLGVEGQYLEGIKLADKAIKQLTAYGKTLFMPEPHFNKCFNEESFRLDRRISLTSD